MYISSWIIEGRISYRVKCNLTFKSKYVFLEGVDWAVISKWTNCYQKKNWHWTESIDLGVCFVTLNNRIAIQTLDWSEWLISPKHTIGVFSLDVSWTWTWSFSTPGYGGCDVTLLWDWSHFIQTNQMTTQSRRCLSYLGLGRGWYT